MYNRNWENAKDYYYTKALTRELWAWEFLRRNETYVAEWKRTLQKNYSDIQYTSRKINKQISDLLDHGKGSFNISPGYGKDITADNLDDRTIRFLEWLRVNENKQFRKILPITIPSKNARNKWGLMIDLINPYIDEPHLFQDYPIFHLYGLLHDKDTIKILFDLPDSEVVANFDLLEPIPQQLEHFKPLLLKAQETYLKRKRLKIKQTRRNDELMHDLWTRYLRILDAKLDGASWVEMGKVIFPNDTGTRQEIEKKVIKNHAQANKLVKNKGYLQILRKPVQRRSKEKGED